MLKFRLRAISALVPVVLAAVLAGAVWASAVQGNWTAATELAAD